MQHNALKSVRATLLQKDQTAAVYEVRMAHVPRLLQHIILQCDLRRNVLYSRFRL